MARKPETRRQTRIQAALRKAFPRCYVRKIHGNPFQRKGIGDLLCCIEGLFFAFEVKEPTEDLDTHQETERDFVIAAGGISARVVEPQEAIDLVHRRLIKRRR